MTAPDGGFYSTQDADSEGEEGKYYVWSETEIRAALPPEDARLFCYAYDVTPQGNWEGVNILNRPKTDAQAAQVLGVEVETLRTSLARSRRTLLALREQRVPPGRDEKILTSWNGLMISALAMARRVLAESRYTAAAVRAADFLLTRIRDPEGRLRHSFQEGQARFNAYLDDYAALIDSLVELHQTTDDPRWLSEALALAEQMQTQFADPAGGFFYTPSDHEPLLTRPKDVQDNATPSGNALAATALLRLGRLTGRGDLEEAGYRTLATLSGLMAEHPRAAAQSLLALDFHLGPAWEVAIVDGPDRNIGDEFRAALARHFAPQVLTARRPVGVADADLPPPVRPLLAGRPPADRTQFYVCERGSCRLPVTTVPEALAQLGLSP
jgi:uncharacterized protein YyaL (SSP411 family)